MWRALIAYFVVLGLSACTVGPARNQTGSISGHVYMWTCGKQFQAGIACNPPMPGAVVVFEGENATATFSTGTDQSGAFTIELPPGRYFTKRKFVTSTSHVADWSYGPHEIAVSAGQPDHADFAFVAIRQ